MRESVSNKFRLIRPSRRKRRWERYSIDRTTIGREGPLLSLVINRRKPALVDERNKAVKIIAMARIEVAIVNLIEKIIQRFDVLILRLRQVGNAVIFSKFARARIMREQQRWSTSKGRRDVPVNARTKGKVIPSQFFDPRPRIERK